eukprot:gnl/TRDRNA2_/TRDRNA2_164952_c1_seq2.p1 gnl/TRDRNA2_/TRDRNA2_164952_c1~~gnl/TRDRNA2_/TRDRNA2_164952_c1_seq2.p1  ORF type:complete len:114 (-),score=0.83 gnl/TRDRNA2_/TRDRNA2_164952_c1_seq2:80-421(-)
MPVVPAFYRLSALLPLGRGKNYPQIFCLHWSEAAFLALHPISTCSSCHFDIRASPVAVSVLFCARLSLLLFLCSVCLPLPLSLSRDWTAMSTQSDNAHRSDLSLRSYLCPAAR